MANTRNEHYEDDFVDFDGFFDDDTESELAFEKMSSKRHQKVKHRRETRRRLDDYFEHKALKEKEWDLFDLEDEIYH